MNRVLTVRLRETQLAQLETLARFDGVALAEEIREAVELLLASRRDDPEFLQRVRDSFEEARTLLGELEGTDAVVKALDTPVEAQREERPAAQRAWAIRDATPADS